MSSYEAPAKDFVRNNSTKISRDSEIKTKKLHKVFPYKDKDGYERISYAEAEQKWERSGHVLSDIKKMQTEGVIAEQDVISRIKSGSRLVTDYEILVLTRICNVSADWIKGYSPQAALDKIKEDNLSFSVTLSKWTVYKYIDDGVFLRLTNKALPMGGKKKQKHEKIRPARVQPGGSIEERPKVVKTREEPFHWEMDSVLSAKEGGSKKRFLTMTKRMTRADRMIRRKIPKGTDFTDPTEEDTLEVQRWVNEYPRGILGGRCAGRVLLEVAKKAGVEGVESLL